MDNLLLVTKIINNTTGEDVYVMIDKTTYRKYFSKEKDRYVPYNDSNFLENVNNNKISNSEVFDKLKKQAIRAVVIVTGCSIASFGFLKTYEHYEVVKEKEFYQALVINYNDSESISKEFSRIVDLNDNFTDKEKELLKEGTSSFFRDWGYLFSEDDINNLLYRIKRLNVTSQDSLGYNVAGSYWNLNVKMLDREDYLTAIHEYLHCMMDHNGINGFRDENGLGRAIDEAITESLTQHYYYCLINEKDRGQYRNERMSLSKISFLIDSETLIKRCFIGNQPIVEIFKENCPGVDEEKILKYLTMLDIDCSGSFDKEYIPEAGFYNEIDSLFKELYLAKYGKEYLSTVSLQRNDFLSKNVTFTYGNFDYTMPKQKFTEIDIDDLSMESGYNEYITGLNYQYSDSFGLEPLLLFGSSNEEREFILNNPNAFLLELYKKYQYDTKKQQEIMDILLLTENSFDSYFNLYIDLLKERDLHPSVFAAELKKGLSVFENNYSLTTSDVDSELYSNDMEYRNEIDMKYGGLPDESQIRNMLSNKWMQELSKKVDLIGDADISFWFNDTNVYFIKYDYTNMENCSLNSGVIEEKNVDSFLTIDNKQFIVTVDEDYLIKSEDDFEYSLITDTQLIKSCNETFDMENVKYFFVTVSDEYLDNDNINSTLETSNISFKQIRLIEIPENLKEPYRNTDSKQK